MATHASDLLPLMQILAGPDNECTATLTFTTDRWPSHLLKKSNTQTNVDMRVNYGQTGTVPLLLKSPLKVGPTMVVLNVRELSGGSWLVSRQHKELKIAHQRVVNCLQHAGCEVKNIQIPEMRDAFDIWSAMMHQSNEIDFWTCVTETLDNGAQNSN